MSHPWRRPSALVYDRKVACRRQSLYNFPVAARRVATSNYMCVVLRINCCIAIIF
jgi:hypothetical protein